MKQVIWFASAFCALTAAFLAAWWAFGWMERHPIATVCGCLVAYAFAARYEVHRGRKRRGGEQK